MMNFICIGSSCIGNRPRYSSVWEFLSLCVMAPKVSKRPSAQPVVRPEKKSKASPAEPAPAPAVQENQQPSTRQVVKKEPSAPMNRNACSGMITALKYRAESAKELPESERSKAKAALSVYCHDYIAFEFPFPCSSHKSCMTMFIVDRCIRGWPTKTSTSFCGNGSAIPISPLSGFPNSSLLPRTRLAREPL